MIPNANGYNSISLSPCNKKSNSLFNKGLLDDRIRQLSFTVIQKWEIGPELEQMNCWN